MMIQERKDALVSHRLSRSRFTCVYESDQEAYEHQEDESADTAAVNHGLLRWLTSDERKTQRGEEQEESAEGHGSRRG